MRLKALFFLLFSLSLLSAGPQGSVERKSSFGLWAHFNINKHNSDFTKLPGVPSCCPRFTNGNGLGISAGMLYEIPLSSVFFLDLRAGYYLLSGSLVTNEDESVNIDGTAMKGIFEHSIDATLGVAGIEPSIGFRIFDGLSFNAGLLAGVLVPKTYKHMEQIIEPEGAAFDNAGNTLRMYSDGTLPESALIYAAWSARLSWEFPLNGNRTVWIAPEFAVTGSLTEIVKDIDWGITNIRLGVALKFSPPYELKMRLDPEIRDIKINEYHLCDNRKLYFSEPDSVEFDVVYESETGIDKYSFAVLQNNLTLDWHDIKAEQVPPSVVWKIPPHLPEKLFMYPDSLHFVLQVYDKTAQTRVDSSLIRIETGKTYLSAVINAFHPDKDELLSEIYIEDLVNSGNVATSINPESADFRTSYSAMGEIGEWKLSLITESSMLFDTTGAGNPPEKIMVNLKNALSGLPNGYSKPIRYIFEIKDSLGNLCTDEKMININRKAFTISSQLTAFSVYPTDFGNEVKPNPAIKIEEMISTRLQPILNYVFFDENSSVIPSRYKKLTQKKPKSFNLDDMHDMPTLKTYYNILNIIGKRMQEIPTANITITGCNSNIGLEKNNLALSEQRAKAVYNYLNDIWDIPEGRMKIQIRNLPEQASSAKTAPNQDNIDGAAENRRVEIESDNYEILKPLLTYGKRYKIEPPALYLKAKVNSEIPVESWNIKYISNGVMIDSMGVTNSSPDSIFWDVESRKVLVSETRPRRLNVAFGAVNQKGQKTFAETAVPVEIISKSEGEGKDTTYDEYSLILFDFASDKIGESNQKIIDIIKQRVNPGATVSIVGHTDRVGSEKANQKLSEKRAKASEKALSFEKENFNVIATGSGESDLLYFNDLPEGRFYCRTVKIDVVNPVTK